MSTDYPSPFPLPQELNFEIIHNLCPKDLATVSLTCRSLLYIARHKLVWKRLSVAKWIPQEFFYNEPSFDWRLYYREKQAFTEKTVSWNLVDTPDSNFPTPRQSHGATVVDNKLFLFGGHQIIGETFVRKDDAWLYDPTHGSFEQLTLNGPIQPISRHKCLSFGGKVYSFGGILQEKKKINTVFCIDINSREIKELEVKGNAPEPRCDAVVVAYKHNIVVFGGSVGDFIFPSDVHLFDTLTQTWTQLETKGEAPSTRIGCTAVVIGDKLYLYGGGNWCRLKRKYLQLFSEVWSLDLINFTWKLEPSLGQFPPMSDFLNSFVIGNHFVIEGGWYSYPWAYDTISHQWHKIVTNSLLNNNDSSCTRIGNDVFYYGGYHNQYQHHLVKMDLSPLSFLL